jgi:DNA-binding CsgD family transcriptional regulator
VVTVMPTTMLRDREAQLATLGRLADRALSGRGGLALVEGPPGAGRSALLARFAELQQDRPVWTSSARAAEDERDFPFGLVRQLLEPALWAASPEDREELFDGAAGLARPVLDGIRMTGDAAVLASTESLFSSLHGLYWLTANLAVRQRMLLLLVDDVHYVDPPSERFLRHLARRLDDLPVLLVLSAPAGRRPDILEPLRVLPYATAIDLPPLGPAGVRADLEARFGRAVDRAFAAVCRDATGGNPGALHRLSRALVTAGIEPSATAVADVMRHADRLRTAEVLGSRDPAVAKLLAAVAALTGSYAPPALTLAARLAGLSAEESDRAATALAEQGVVRPEQRTEFVRPELADAVLAALPLAARADLHTRTARLLRAEGAPTELIARHVLRSTEAVPTGTEPAQTWMVDVLVAAARDAVVRGAPETAVPFLRRALREAPPHRRFDLLVEVAAAELQSDPGAAVEHLSAALRLRRDDPARDRARITLQLCTALLLDGRADEAVRAVAAALAELDISPGDEADDLIGALLGRYVSLAYKYAPAVPDMVRAMDRVRPPMHCQGEGQRALLSAMAIKATAEGTSAKEAAKLAQDARMCLTNPLTAHYLIDIAAGLALLYADDLPAATSWFDSIIAAGQQSGAVRAYTTARCAQALLAHRTGSVPDALAEAEAAYRLRSQEDWGTLLAVPLFVLIGLLVDDGRLTEAQRLAAIPLPPQVTDATFEHAWFLEARGRLREASGDLSGALADFVACGRHATAGGLINPAVVAWRSRSARARFRMGEPASAVRDLIEEELQLAERWGTPRPIGTALLTLGEITEGRAGLIPLSDAVDRFRQCVSPLELARALLALGRRQLALGDLREARETLRNALDEADRSGAAPLLREAQDLLRAAGSRPRRVRRTGLAALTPAERKVTMLAAQGHSNREIAEALFVTQRTVEMHLTKAYGKLNITGRHQLGEVS